MDMFRGVISIQKEACGGLRRLAAVNAETGNQIKIGEAGGIEAIVAAIQQHKEDAGLEEDALIALKHLSCLPENQIKIGQAGGIEAIVTARQGT
eukprot:748339-Hanusia_phi.AAC.1